MGPGNVLYRLTVKAINRKLTFPRSWIKKYLIQHNIGLNAFVLINSTF